MRIILLGPPGAGKGTQAKYICNDFNLTPISTGEILRAEVLAKSEIGQKIEQRMSQGQLVPDQMMIDIIKKRISGSEGFLLDGFPRTLEQAKALEKAGIPIDHVVCIDVPDHTIVQRLSGRMIHPSSGRTYHVSMHPVALDDVTGERLVQRQDDKEEVVRERLNIYHQVTEPLIEWYKTKIATGGFIRVSGEGTVEEVRAQIYDCLHEKKKR